ncbi:hypothetical protein CBR_g49010 [Chara braunii]|uniref:Integrase catalytic domain-containing protein n=1 Tax=Chara braunii TaxID=69332 RepID=A0A388M426_CHABU|nr:hypothetical protein CBR_g49010 [Chara braunii]|eukprot:GBG89301.1 hypothetical protein CBR_g49010 [Chara braunii]
MATTPNNGTSSETLTSSNAEPLPVCPVQGPNESITDYIQRVKTYTGSLTLARERQDAAEAEKQRLAAEAAAQAQRQAEAEQLATDKLNADSADLLISQHDQWAAVLNGMRYVPVAGADPMAVQQERQNLADILLCTMRALIWNSTMGALHSRSTRQLQHDLNHNVKTLAAAIKIADSQLQQMDTHIAALEAKPSQAVPGERIDPVVNLIGELGDFTSLATISSTVAAIKTDVTKLQTRPDAATRTYKMPHFNISKFDDYNKTNALTWRQSFFTEAYCCIVLAEDMMRALYLQLIGGAQAWMNHLAATKKCTIAELHMHIPWKEFEQLWFTRFMVRNVVKAAMNEVYTSSQGSMPTRDRTIKWQKIVTTPGFDLSFPNQRSEFFSRSCAGLRTTLSNEYDYASFHAILDRVNLVIQTDDKAANERQSQTHYVAKQGYQRPAHNNVVIYDESVDLHATTASSSDGGTVAALPPKRPKRVRKNKATQATTTTGTGQQPWTAYNTTKEEVQEFLSGYGVVANYTTTAHPQANAPVERVHSTITNLLAKWTKGRPNQWPRYLRAAFFVENITVRRSTKYAPATLWYGRHATFPIESFLKTWRRQDLEVNLSFEELLDIRARQVGAIENRIQEASNQVERSRMDDKARWDQSARVRKVPLAVGDVVLLYYSSLEKQWSRKLDKRWLGPYRIVRCGDFGAYQIEELNGTKWKDWVSGTRLKKFVAREERSRRQRDPEPSEARPSRGGRKALARREEEPSPEVEERGAYPECGLGPVEFHRFTEGGLRRSPVRTREETLASEGPLRELEAHLDVSRWGASPRSVECGGQAEEMPREEMPREEIPREEVPREEVPREEARDTQRERRLGDEGRRAGKEVIEQRGEGLPSPTRAGFGVARKVEERLDRKIKLLTKTSFDRYLMLKSDLAGKKMKEEGHGVRLETMGVEIEELRALVASQAMIIADLRQQLQGRTDRPESSRQGEKRQPGPELLGQLPAVEPRQEPPMGRVILEPEEAKAKREAEREAFEFRAPTELATLPTVTTKLVMPSAVEEGHPPSSNEPAQGSVEGSLDVVLEAVGTMQEEASLFSPEQRTEELLEGEMGVEIEDVAEGRPQRLDTPEYGPEGIGIRPGPSTQELGAEPRESVDAPQSCELSREASEAPSSPGSQRGKKRSGKWFDTSCVFFTKEGHRALQCPKFLKDKAEGKVTEEGGRMYDRQGRIVERSADGGRAQLYRQNQEEMSE